MLQHLPYSPDLAPSDFHLFRFLKESLRGQKFDSDENVIHAIDDWGEGLHESFFLDGVKALERRWAKCVELRGDYVEKL